MYRIPKQAFKSFLEPGLFIGLNDWKEPGLKYINNQYRVNNLLFELRSNI